MASIVHWILFLDQNVERWNHMFVEYLHQTKQKKKKKKKEKKRKEKEKKEKATGHF